MPQASVYLDTTVPSAYFDERAPDRKRLTEDFWTIRLPEFEGTISVLVLLEIRNTPENQKRLNMDELVRKFRVLDFDAEADRLAQEYVRRGIFPEKYVRNHRSARIVRRSQMNDLSQSKKKKLLEEASAEFPDDEMMRDIHYVRLVQYHQTKNLSTSERVRFYQQSNKGAVTTKRHTMRKVAKQS